MSSIIPMVMMKASACETGMPASLRVIPVKQAGTTREKKNGLGHRADMNINLNLTTRSREEAVAWDADAASQAVPWI